MLTEDAFQARRPTSHFHGIIERQVVPLLDERLGPHGTDAYLTRVVDRRLDEGWRSRWMPVQSAQV